MALACQGRILSQSRNTVLGLPEVKLGLLPGLNGLQRLAQLVGLQVALDYGLTGKNMRPRRAKQLGVADDVVPEPILKQVAIARALELAQGENKTNGKRPVFNTAHITQMALEQNPLGRMVLFKKAREALRAKTGGHYPAPERIVEVLETFAERGFEIIEKLWRATLEAISQCPCAVGCPSCVQSPKCGNNNHPLDKAFATEILQALCSPSK